MAGFRQKIIIIVIAVAIVGTGLWYLQTSWKADDPANIQVSAEVERRIWALLEKSKTAGFAEKIAIIQEINGFGREGLPVMVAALEDPDPSVRALAINILQYSDNLAVIPHLEAKISDKDPLVRRSAVVALGHLGAFETVPSILLVLNDGDKVARCEAALVLGTIGGDTAVEPLIETLGNDPYPVARQTAANSLGQIGSDKAVGPLVNSLADENPLVRSASLVALNRITSAGLGMDRGEWVEWLNENSSSPVLE